ncbi:MAG: hypothetical protein EWM50_05520 [Gottschalkiaceae bacterium]|nr:MAG: hypothetical protein EWM50_05520 [Gottschalkiaceae bacterium]
MNDLQIFNNKEFGQVRVLEKNGHPWFVARDITKILEYVNSSDALTKHVDYEDKDIAKCDTLGGKQDMVVINESGLYSLILGSKLPNAKKFKKWVTSEVLPSIRKHGAYMTDNVIDQVLNNPDFGIKLLTELKAEREEKKLLQAKIEQDKPKVLFAEALEIAQNSILVGELAKLLARNGIEDMGQNRLFKWLRANGYLHKSGEQYNLPTQYSIDLEIIETKTTTINNPDGSVRVTKTPKITCKGQIYFINKFKGKEIA